MTPLETPKYPSSDPSWASNTPFHKLITIKTKKQCKTKKKQTNRLLAVPQDGHASEEIERSERNGKKQEAEGKLGRRRERRKGLHSLLNQTCSGNSTHQRRQPVKNKLICHLITNNCDLICRPLYPHWFAAL